jgi:hypothetical protein
MPSPKDDLEAVRLVADALEGFEANDQERIIRWVREKIGLSVAPETFGPRSSGNRLLIEPMSTRPSSVSCTESLAE